MTELLQLISVKYGIGNWDGEGINEIQRKQDRFYFMDKNR